MERKASVLGERHALAARQGRIPSAAVLGSMALQRGQAMRGGPPSRPRPALQPKPESPSRNNAPGSALDAGRMAAPAGQASPAGVPSRPLRSYRRPPRPAEKKPAPEIISFSLDMVFSNNRDTPVASSAPPLSTPAAPGPVLGVDGGTMEAPAGEILLHITGPEPRDGSETGSGPAPEAAPAVPGDLDRVPTTPLQSHSQPFGGSGGRGLSIFSGGRGGQGGRGGARSASCFLPLQHPAHPVQPPQCPSTPLETSASSEPLERLLCIPTIESAGERAEHSPSEVHILCCRL